jgi:hypothetical protein
MKKSFLYIKKLKLKISINNNEIKKLFSNSCFYIKYRNK